MQFSNLKSALFCLMAIVAISLSMTSCNSTLESEEVLEIVEAPQDFNSAPDFSEDRTSAEDEASRSGCTFCKHKGASHRTATSSYVYCHGNKHNTKTYRLSKGSPFNYQVIASKTTNNYYTYFDNLVPGARYCYNVITKCQSGATISHRKWTCFIN